MIPTPPGWTRIDVGVDVVFLPPGGPEHGAIRLRCPLRPVLPVAELARGQLADDPQLAVESIAPPQLLVTVEGERAAVVVASGRLDGRAALRCLGFVLGDDFYARVGAVAFGDFDRFRDVTLELTRRVSLRLTGRRRVEHDGPPGWRPHRVGLRTDWLAPEFPRDPSCVTIWPAVPRARASSAPPAAPPESGISAPTPLRTARGLQGWAWLAEGRFADGTPRRRDLVLLEDAGFRYACRLDTTPELRSTCRTLFVTVLDDLCPAPQRPGQARDRASDVGEHWSD